MVALLPQLTKQSAGNWQRCRAPVTPCCLVPVSQCLWCASSGRCVEYPVRRILPTADLCELRSARWGVCWGKWIVLER